jgi:hypothetical protein
METLGLSDSGPRTDSRLKSLFWPSIQTGTDVDYLGSQGYWICTFVAVVSLIFLLIRGETIAAFSIALFYYLGGVGVREGSRYAAAVVLLMYVLDTFFSGVGVMRVIFIALLLSNMRATWIASTWRPESEEAAPPPRLSETLADKFADQLPTWLWPKLRIPFYIFSAGFLLLVLIGLSVPRLRH